MLTIAVPFVQAKPEQNPNLRVRSDSGLAYMRAMTVTFASIRRWNADAVLKFVSDQEPRGVHRSAFDLLGVEHVSIPFRHKPPVGFTATFEASIYMLDALEVATRGDTLFLDPDILCVDSLSGLMEAAGTSVAGALRMDFAPDEDINGLSRRQASELHAELGEPVHIANHYGGEIYLVPQTLAMKIAARSEKAWRLSLERYSKGLTRFITEEHVLSYALRGVPTIDLNDFGRRIWTTHRHRQVQGDEHLLALWHLPAEKARGFGTLYGPALDLDSWFWKSSRREFLKRAGRAMGLHQRRMDRAILDTIGSGLNLIEVCSSALGRR